MGIKIKRPPCIGEILAQLYATMSMEVKTSNMSEEARSAAYWAMHMTDFRISSVCACERCKKHVLVLQSFIEGIHGKLRDENGVQDGSQQEADGRSDSQS